MIVTPTKAMENNNNHEGQSEATSESHQKRTAVDDFKHLPAKKRYLAELQIKQQELVQNIVKQNLENTNLETHTNLENTSKPTSSNLTKTDENKSKKTTTNSSASEEEGNTSAVTNSTNTSPSGPIVTDKNEKIREESGNGTGNTTNNGSSQQASPSSTSSGQFSDKRANKLETLKNAESNSPKMNKEESSKNDSVQTSETVKPETTNSETNQNLETKSESKIPANFVNSTITAQQLQKPNLAVVSNLHNLRTGQFRLTNAKNTTAHRLIPINAAALPAQVIKVATPVSIQKGMVINSPSPPVPNYVHGITQSVKVNGQKATLISIPNSNIRQMTPVHAVSIPTTKVQTGTSARTTPRDKFQTTQHATIVRPASNITVSPVSLVNPTTTQGYKVTQITPTTSTNQISNTASSTTPNSAAMDKLTQETLSRLYYQQMIQQQQQQAASNMLREQQAQKLLQEQQQQAQQQIKQIQLQEILQTLQANGETLNSGNFSQIMALLKQKTDAIMAQINVNSKNRLNLGLNQTIGQNSTGNSQGSGLNNSSSLNTSLNNLNNLGASFGSSLSNNLTNLSGNNLLGTNLNGINLNAANLTSSTLTNLTSLGSNLTNLTNLTATTNLLNQSSLNSYTSNNLINQVSSSKSSSLNNNLANYAGLLNNLNTNQYQVLSTNKLGATTTITTSPQAQKPGLQQQQISPNNLSGNQNQKLSPGNNSTTSSHQIQVPDKDTSQVDSSVTQFQQTSTQFQLARPLISSNSSLQNPTALSNLNKTPILAHNVSPNSESQVNSHPISTDFSNNQIQTSTNPSNQFSPNNQISPTPKSRKASSESSSQLALNQALTTSQLQSPNISGVHPITSLKQLTENQNPNNIKPVSIGSGESTLKLPEKSKKEKKKIEKQDISGKNNFLKKAEQIFDKTGTFLNLEEDELCTKLKKKQEKSLGNMDKSNQLPDNDEVPKISLSQKTSPDERILEERIPVSEIISELKTPTLSKKDDSKKSVSYKPEKSRKSEKKGERAEKGKPGRKKGSGGTTSKRKSAPASESVSSEKNGPMKKKKRHNSTSQVDKDPNAVTGVKETIESSQGIEYQIDPQDDSWNSVTCFCGKPFHGRLMVECESCEIWYHADCVGLIKNSIPEKFICDRKSSCIEFAAKLPDFNIKKHAPTTKNNNSKPKKQSKKSKGQKIKK